MTWPVATVICFALALLFSYRINTRHIDRTPRLTGGHEPTHSREIGPPPDARKPVMDADTWAKDLRRRIEERAAEQRVKWTNRMQTWWGKGFD